MNNYHTITNDRPALTLMNSAYIAQIADSKYRNSTSPIVSTEDTDYKVYWTEDSLLNYGYPNGDTLYINEYEMVCNEGLIGLGAWLFYTGTGGVSAMQLVDNYTISGEGKVINNLPVNNNYKLSVIYGPELKG